MAQGLSAADAAARIWVVDVQGLLTDDRTDLSPGQQKFAQPADRVAGWGLSGPAQLADVVHNVDAGILMGLSTAAGAFTEDIVRDLAGKTEPGPSSFRCRIRRVTPRRTPPSWTMDRGARAHRHRFAVRAVATQWNRAPDRTVQQRLHLPRDGAGGDRGAGHPRHRRDDEGGGRDTRRRLARLVQPGRSAAARMVGASRHRHEHRPCRRPPGDRGGRRTAAQ